LTQAFENPNLSLMGSVSRSLAAEVLLACLCVGTWSLAGCGGSSSPTLEQPTVEAGPDVLATDTGSPPPPPDAGHHDSAADAAVETGGDDGGGQPPPDAAPIVLVGPQGRPGQDIVTGGAVSKSKSYILYSTIGEGPGGNGVMKSPGHKLITGLLGTTQP